MMKKGLVWLALVCLVMCLGGCAPQTGILPSPVTVSVPEEDDGVVPVPYTVGVYERLDFRSSHITEEIQPTILRSRSDLEKAAEEDLALAPYVDTYDNLFFWDKALLLLQKNLPSGSQRIRIDALQRQGKELQLAYTLVMPNMQTCDIANWQFLLEIKQVDIQGVTDVTFTHQEEHLPSGVPLDEDSLY